MLHPLARGRAVLAGMLLGAALLSAGCANLGRPREDFRAVIQRAQEQVFPALVFLKPIKQHLAAGERQREQDEEQRAQEEEQDVLDAAAVRGPLVTDLQEPDRREEHPLRLPPVDEVKDQRDPRRKEPD